MFTHRPSSADHQTSTASSPLYRGRSAQVPDRDLMNGGNTAPPKHWPATALGAFLHKPHPQVREAGSRHRQMGASMVPPPTLRVQRGNVREWGCGPTEAQERGGDVGK